MSSTPRHALVIRGGWEGHSPVAATDLFVPFLSTSGYDVRVEESLDVLTDAAVMAGTDLVVQCWTMGSISQEQLAGLTAAVRAGTGLAGWHGGIADAFRASSDYLHLVGGQFAAHPGKPAAECTPGAAENNFLPHRITIRPERADHPIVAGLDDFDLVTEQYWVLTDEYNDVLATTTHPARDDQPWHREVTCPAVWTRDWGQGRVFVATPGHQPSVLEHPAVRTIVERGLLWASR
ncbi:ThuA domain-containing protein [Jiangella gansuensis]|uniref:ThuA domain-containing protein n=1 Tax=Jiangella gansuensis TaxID=281473 RepID=UPI0004B75C99|nr:ThuA domain-containing protein [Jiangella gansuensis]